MATYNYTNNGEKSAAQEFERSAWAARINTVSNSLSRAYNALYSPSPQNMNLPWQAPQNLTRNVASVSYNAVPSNSEVEKKPVIKQNVPLTDPTVTAEAAIKTSHTADSHEFSLSDQVPIYDDETMARLTAARGDIGEIHGDRGVNNG